MKIVIDDCHGSYELFTKVLMLIIGEGTESQSIIDLCCNTAPVTSRLPFSEKVLMDVEPREIPEYQANFYQADVLGDHELLSRRYNVCTCLDGIEHLPKPDGWRLIERAKALADKAIFFTPLGEWMLDHPGTPQWEDPKTHKSGWLPGDLELPSITFPKYHPQLNIGAFFFWYTDNIEADFLRVEKLVNSVDWHAFPQETT